MHELTKLIKEDMKPALGVTEPGAIAFAVASARDYTKGEIRKVTVKLNSGMYKNAFTCGIPNTDEVGNVYAAALGAAGGKASLGLEALADVTKEQEKAAFKLVEEGRVEAVLDHMGSQITIDASVETAEDTCTVHIQGGHTDIRRIEKNGETIYEAQPDKADSESEESEALIHKYTLKEILEYVDNAEGEELAFIKEAFQMNIDLLEEGIASDKTVFAPWLMEKNKNELFSTDALSTAQLLCGGAIEARVMGLSKPAMSVTGSGAHGIIATVPLLAYYKAEKESEGMEYEVLLRAAALSCLITMYIKEYSGRLSAFCGCGIAAGTGMACGLAYLAGGGENTVERVIRNMASGITGMICDGGNQGCVMKAITATDAAFRAADLAGRGIAVEPCHGINGSTAEETMRYMGMIASPGMIETERTIVEIMQEKR